MTGRILISQRNKMTKTNSLKVSKTLMVLGYRSLNKKNLESRNNNNNNIRIKKK